ncbi:hypothetical protein WJX77_001084 [Trebouxia sp. C0004]
MSSSRVNKRFHRVSQHDTVWTCLYLSEFDSTGHPQLNLSWKDTFRERAQRERVRLNRKRQASLVRLQSKVQVYSANFRRATADLTEECAKLAAYQEELQLLKRLRSTANATQCWTPAAVSKGFETFLAQAPIDSDWRLEQVQQLMLDSKMHCRTVEKTLNKNKHDMQQAQRALQALQGA